MEQITHNMEHGTNNIKQDNYSQFLSGHSEPRKKESRIMNYE